MTDLETYALNTQQAAIARSETDGAEAFLERAYVELALEGLAEAGVIDDATVCLHRSVGIQVSGFSIGDDGETLDLFVAVHTNEVPPRTVLKAEVVDAFKRLSKFLEVSTKGYFRTIEEATPAFDLAQMIHTDWRRFSLIRLILVTDGIYRNAPPSPRALDGFRLLYDIWDAQRFYQDWSSGREREEIQIDFEALIGRPVACLAMDNSVGGYTSLLSIFPGHLLVELYGRYGPRLLERNVRSFLQVKGSVNKGIRDTIRDEPGMFLAYNNGLSCTASAVEVERDASGITLLKRAQDLQIVNGGQTTASIYHASVKDKADVSSIGVQVKLTILKNVDRMDEIVPRISKYANSQNAVKTDDLRANDKFHRRVEELSRTIWAPARDGTIRQTRWYYERARGQYRDDLARERTPAQKKAFEATHPKEQMFTKTDLAKFALTWEKRPNVVSKGAQYAFSSFTLGLEGHIKVEGPVDAPYFERLAAKAILFKQAERIARELKFPGYRANIVTYSIAKLVHMMGERIDLERIWRDQAISAEIESALEKVERSCYDFIIEKAGGGNVTQFCKREECWAAFRERYVSLPDAVVRAFTRRPGPGELDHRAEPIHNGQGFATDSDVQRVLGIGAMTWMALASYGTEHRLFTPKQLELLTTASLTIGEGRHPTKKTAEIALALLGQAETHGFKAAAEADR